MMNVVIRMSFVKDTLISYYVIMQKKISQSNDRCMGAQSHPVFGALMQ